MKKAIITISVIVTAITAIIGVFTLCKFKQK